MSRPKTLLRPRAVRITIEADEFEALRRVAYERKSTISGVAREMIRAGVKAFNEASER